MSRKLSLLISFFLCISIHIHVFTDEYLNYPLHNRHNIGIDLDFYRQIRYANATDVNIIEEYANLCMDDEFIAIENLKDFSIDDFIPAQDRARCMLNLHMIWSKISYHYDEAWFYAHKINDIEIMEQVIKDLAIATIAITSVKQPHNAKSTITTEAITKITKFSIDCCNYMQMKYHMYRAREATAEWDKIFLLMKDKKYL